MSNVTKQSQNVRSVRAQAESVMDIPNQYNRKQSPRATRAPRLFRSQKDSCKSLSALQKNAGRSSSSFTEQHLSFRVSSVAPSGVAVFCNSAWLNQQFVMQWSRSAQCMRTRA